MTRLPKGISAGALALAAAAACATAACGREGSLDRPGPMFGLPRTDLADPAAHVRAGPAPTTDTLGDTVTGVGNLTSPGQASLDRPLRVARLTAQEQSAAQAQDPDAPRSTTGDRPVRTQRDGTTPTRGVRDGVHSNDQPDDAPVTPRDIRDPAQRLTPLSAAPIPGVPDPLGPPISTAPPN